MARVSAVENDNKQLRPSRLSERAVFRCYLKVVLFTLIYTVLFLVSHFNFFLFIP